MPTSPCDTKSIATGSQASTSSNRGTFLAGRNKITIYTLTRSLNDSNEPKTRSTQHQRTRLRNNYGRACDASPTRATGFRKFQKPNTLSSVMINDDTQEFTPKWKLDMNWTTPHTDNGSVLETSSARGDREFEQSNLIDHPDQTCDANLLISPPSSLTAYIAHPHRAQSPITCY